MTDVSFDYMASRRSACVTGLVLVVAFHVVVAALLLRLDAVRSAVRAALPITVSLIDPPKKIEPQVLPKPVPVKPHVQRQKPPPPPVMTAVTEAPSPFVAPPAPPVTLVPIERVPDPVALPTPVVAPPAPPPPPVTPPSFNADYLNNPPPAYPAVSRRMHEEGKVVLRVYVSEQGLPRDVQLRTSSGHSRLDGAALEAVRQWRFVPARRGDTALGAWVLVPIVFSLRS